MVIALQEITSILLQHDPCLASYKRRFGLEGYFSLSIFFVWLRPRAFLDTDAEENRAFKNDDWRTRRYSHFAVKSQIADRRISYHKALFFPRGGVGVQCCCDSPGLFFPHFHIFKTTQTKQLLRMSTRNLLEAQDDGVNISSGKDISIWKVATSVLCSTTTSAATEAKTKLMKNASPLSFLWIPEKLKKIWHSQQIEGLR